MQMQTDRRKGQPAQIALTFDDGPDPVWTRRVLAALGRADATATFFVCAPAAARHPDVIEEITGAGHDVGFHCLEHIRHSESTRERIDAETATGLEQLARLGVTPELWRTPWGDTAPWTRELARDLGLRLCGWTDDTHDWRGDSAASMLAKLRGDIAPGSVVLMHDGIGPGARRTDCAPTADLVESLADLAAARDLAITRLGDM